MGKHVTKAAAHLKRRLQEAPNELVVVAKALMMCGLPHESTDKRSVKRKARIGSRAEITVTYTAVGDYGLPYGTDRAVLAWIQTQAFVGNGYVFFGSLRELFKRAKISTGGSAYEMFKDSINRLKNLSIQIEITDGNDVITVNTHPIKMSVMRAEGKMEELEAKIRADGNEQLMLELYDEDARRYGFALDPDFMRYFEGNFASMPHAVVRKLRRHPVKWDFAMYVLYRATAAAVPSVVPWEALIEHIQTTDSNRRRVRLKLDKVLGLLKEHCPGLQVAFDEYDLVVYPWRPKRGK